MGVAAVGSLIVRALFGQSTRLPPELVAHYPEFASVRWRRGGLPPRVGGWWLGRSTVAAITLGRTVFLAPGARLDPALLLHECRHVTQFQRSPAFPLLYIVESLRRGYHHNRFEVDARDYAAARLQGLDFLP